MGDTENIRKTAAKVLSCVEKVSSFATSIDPLFGIVTSLVAVVRKGVYDEEANALEEEFQTVHTKLESISQQNRQTLKQIRIDEIHETFSKYEEYLKHQYQAFSSMVEMVKTDPEHKESHLQDFQDTYERDKGELSLDVFYYGVMGTRRAFGRPLLKVYMEHCDGNIKVMEQRCSHLTNLFHIGLISLMAYTAVIEDDEDDVKCKWTQRVVDIQAKMQEVLSQCH
ncbi:protein rapunzel isoform X2 [Amia ocellicauda]|uniref:protein rapunzel isoform X2 n=1 Tax=Amia ocellicauda TaxID=2972642 RepID=UPI003463F39C